MMHHDFSKKTNLLIDNSRVQTRYRVKREGKKESTASILVTNYERSHTKAATKVITASTNGEKAVPEDDSGK